MAYRVYNTEAVVIDGWPHEDASRRFYLYTKKLGRVLARAKSVRKQGAKLKTGLQIGALSEVELVRGRAGWRVVGVTPKRNFLLGKSSVEIRDISQFFVLFSRLVPAQKRDVVLFLLISDAFLASAGDVDMHNVQTLLLYRVLAHLGHGPRRSSPELASFLKNRDFSASTLEKFSQFRVRAVNDINKTLRSIQL